MNTSLLVVVNVFTFFYKQLVSVISMPGGGLFVNDLNFFYFEIYFLFAIFILLIFFVVLSNKKSYFSKYLNVSELFLNVSFFVILVLILLLNSSSDDSYY